MKVGYLAKTEETKTSKRVLIRDVNGDETKYLINIDDLSTLRPGVVEFEVGEKKYSMYVIVDLKMLTEEECERMGGDAETLFKMNKPLDVPKLTEVMDDIVQFVNETPDPSNIGGGPRHITMDDFKVALTVLFTDMVYNQGTGKWEPKMRLSEFTKQAASTIYHDSQVGGLLRHVAKLVQMMIVTKKMTKYQEYEVHPLTVMIGCFLHDMGKIDQYENKNFEFVLTDWYKYRGSHIGMGLERWARNGRDFLRALKVADEDLEAIFWDVWHIIGSHHGPTRLEYGSFWDPFGHDACSVYALDYCESHEEEGIKPVRQA